MQARKNIWDLVSVLREGRAVVLATHYLDEAEHLSDSILIMKEVKWQYLLEEIQLKCKSLIFTHRVKSLQNTIQILSKINLHNRLNYISTSTVPPTIKLLN